MMEEGEGHDTCIDTHMPEAYEPSETQIKRTGEQARNCKKKVKAHKKSMVTSLTTNDVELIAMTVEDRLS